MEVFTHLDITGPQDVKKNQFNSTFVYMVENCLVTQYGL